MSKVAALSGAQTQLSAGLSNSGSARHSRVAIGYVNFYLAKFVDGNYSIFTGKSQGLTFLEKCGIIKGEGSGVDGTRPQIHKKIGARFYPCPYREGIVY